MQSEFRKAFFVITVSLVLWSAPAVADVEVIAVYEGQRAYLNAALASDSPDLEALAKKHLADPYAATCSKGLPEEDAAYVSEKLGTPIEDLDQLGQSLVAMENFDTAVKLEAQMQKAGVLLPSEDLTTICIEARDPASIGDFELSEKLTKGVAGQHYGAGIVWMSVYPFSDWTKVVTFTAPHEYHHVIRAQIPREHLLDAIVSEGLAEAFALIVNDGQMPTEDWYAVMHFDDETEQRIWAEMEPQLLSEDIDVQRRYLFGAMAGEEDMPPIPGYEFGRRIADAFLQVSPDTSIMDWTLMPSTQILEIGGYDGGVGSDSSGAN